MDFLCSVYKIKRTFWRYAIVFLVSLILPAAVHQILCAAAFDSKDLAILEQYSSLGHYYQNVTRIGYIKGFLYEFSAYVLLFLFFCLFYVMFHKGKVKDLITAAPVFRIKRFLCGVLSFGCIWTVGSILELYLKDGMSHLAVSFTAEDFFIGTALSVLFFLLQAFCEEIIVRGYVQQGLTPLLRSRLLIMLSVAIIFALMHWINIPVAYNGWIAIVPYFLISVCMGCCSILDDGLELSYGVHFINNLLCTVAIKFPQSESYMPSLFTYSFPIVYDWLSIVIGVIQFFALLLIFTKLYHWDWRRLFQKIERPRVSSLSRVDYPILYE